MRVATERRRGRQPARARARHRRLLPAAALEHARGRGSAARARRARPTSRSSSGSPARPRPTSRSSRACAGSAPRLDRRAEPPPTIAPVAGTEVWNASDPDDEVRAIVRGVVDAMRAGVPLERMAVLYASDEPYARLLHEHFDLADIAHNGATTRSMSESVLGRGLLRIFALADTDFARDDVCGLFASAPVLDGRGRPVPAARWERMSREAGIVRGRRASGARGSTRTRRLVRRRRDRGARERAQVDALGAFVAGLAADLDPGAAARARGAGSRGSRTGSCAGSSATRRAASRGRRSSRSRRGGSKPCSTGSARSTRSIPAPTIEVFRRTFELELDAARDRVGQPRRRRARRAGRDGARRRARPACGCAGWPRDCSRRSRATIRCSATASGPCSAASSGCGPIAPPTTSARLLAALASTAGARVCTYPRGDLRRSTEHVPSRFLAATLAAVGDDVRVDPSYAHGAAHVAFPANRHELEVRAAVAGEAWVEAEPPVARGLELTRARAGARVHPLRRQPRAPRRPAAARSARPVPTRVTSPTRLQTWAACPHAYFMQHVLHVEPVERPEDIMQLAPIDRGTLVHEVLDRFLGEARDARRRGPSVDRRRPGAAARDRARRSSAETEARGLTGRRLLWHRDRRADPRRARRVPRRRRATTAPSGVAADARDRARVRHARTPTRRAGRGARSATGASCACGARPTGSIGAPTATSSSSTTRPGRSATYIGARATTTRSPTGTHLQLPVYAYAARAAYGTPDTEVEAYYWFVGRGNNRRIGYDVDAAVDDVFATDGAHDRRRHRGRRVPGARRPSPRRRRSSSAASAIPTAWAPTDRWREWERKFDAPELDGFRSLAERGRRRATTNDRPTRALRRRSATRPRATRSAPSSTPRCSSRRARARARRRRSSTGSSRSSRPTGPTCPCRCARSPRSRSPRRPRPSCATASAGAARPGRRRRPRPQSCGPAAAPRSTTSTRPRSARCTRSRSASSPSSRSRSGCRRASRSATRSRRASRSRRAGASSSTSCSTTPSSSRPLLVLLAAGVKLDAPADGRRGARRQLGPARPHRGAAGRSRRSRSTAGSTSSTRCARPAPTAAPTTTRCSTRLGEFADYRDRLRGAFDDAERIELLLRRRSRRSRSSRTGNKKNWPDIDARARAAS